MWSSTLNAALTKQALIRCGASSAAALAIEELIANPPTSDFPMDTAKKLLEIVPNNEKKKDRHIQACLCIWLSFLFFIGRRLR